MRLRPALPFLLAAVVGCVRPTERVVVYCAQDQEYADHLFFQYRADTSQFVSPKYDTEAAKSVTLAAELEAEAARPRCDLHWNNEILGTIRLARKGVYQPYTSPAAADFPDWSKGNGGLWQAFAERGRVLIVNTDLVPAADRPKSLFDLTAAKWKGKVAMAKPQFGTTATHAACLFEVLGAERAKGYYRDLKANGIHLLAGNKPVARGVADGVYAVGMTDTDDAILELLAKKPVAIIFPDEGGHPDIPRMGTLFIPNTLAVVKDCPNPAGAKRLYDYLLGREELLAADGGYQFPVNPELLDRPHPSLKTRSEVKRMEVDFEKAADLWDETQTFLRDEFAR